MSLDEFRHFLDRNLQNIFLFCFSIYSWMIIVFSAALGYVYIQELSEFSIMHLLILKLIFYPLYLIHNNKDAFTDLETLNKYINRFKTPIIIFLVLFTLSLQDFWRGDFVYILSLPLFSLSQFLFTGKIVVEQFLGGLTGEVLFDLTRIHIQVLWLYVAVNMGYEAATRLLK